MLETENVWPQLPEAIIEDDARHTPGPWHVNGVDAILSLECSVAKVFHPAADARLIAAAPELLEACREAVHILTPDHTPRTLQENAQVRLDAKRTLRAAINKATEGA